MDPWRDSTRDELERLFRWEPFFRDEKGLSEEDADRIAARLRGIGHRARARKIFARARKSLLSLTNRSEIQGRNSIEP